MEVKVEISELSLILKSEAIVLEDPSLAAQQLAEGAFSSDTAVIAMPRAAKLFDLKILERQLPANDNYLTRFVLISR